MWKWRHYGKEGSWSWKKDDWCHAGGVANFAKVGIYGDHDNYGCPCVIGWISEEMYSTNCIHCGRRFE